MHSNYKLDETILKEIVYNNITCTQSQQKPNLIIYYKNKKSSQLVMKNNPSPPIPPIKQTNLVYAFNCDVSPCETTLYIGYTRTSLARRLKSHTYNGSIKKHYEETHGIKVSNEQLINNTTIIAKAPDKYRLTIKEALLISQHAPVINSQFENFARTLKLFRNNIYTNPTIPRALNSQLQPNTRHLQSSPSCDPPAVHTLSRSETTTPPIHHYQSNNLISSQNDQTHSLSNLTFSLSPVTPTDTSFPPRHAHVFKP